MDEIKNTAVDRQAMQLLLAEFKVRGIDAAGAPLSLLNEAWSRMAARLSQATDSEFAALTATLSALLEGERAFDQSIPEGSRRTDSERLRVEAKERAAELVDLVTDWRWQARAAAEPPEPPDHWKAPSGWTPPAGPR